MKLTHKIGKPADFIFNYLTDMRKFTSVHPVIYRIDSLGRHRYLIFERLKIGFISYSFTYKASVRGNFECKTIGIAANVMRFIKIDMFFKILEKEGYSVIEETISFKSFLPLKPILSSVFRAQHQKLFKNIESVREEEASRSPIRVD